MTKNAASTASGTKLEPATRPESAGPTPVRPLVRGVDLDPSTRCRHYHSALDVIAIKMNCCQNYFACIDCHTALAGHLAAVWPRGEWESKAVMCGVCGEEMTVREYMDANNRCPSCAAAFNPGCRSHYHLYFEDASR